MATTGILSVDLQALCANWRAINAVVAPGVAVGAVVKTNAYGLGAAPIIGALRTAGCKEFFFAIREEAQAAAQLQSPEFTRIVLGGVRPGDEPLFAEEGLVPVLFSLQDAKRWLQFCRERQTAFPCVLKVNTGMTRMGLDLAELDAFCATATDFFQPLYLMSHLACADEPQHPANQLQLACFKKALACVRRYFPAIKASLANSAGTLLGSEWHFDLVRPGAALYGINPAPDVPHNFKQVVCLRLPVLQVRELTSCASVGYGAEHKAGVGECLIVVAGGYADGVHRTLGAAPVALFNGYLLNAVGRISMDSCVFDVSSLPAAERPVAGDYIDVLGGSLDVNTVMRRTSGLGYEILTSLGTRYQRRYTE